MKMRRWDEDEEMVKDARPVFAARLSIALTSYLVLLTSFLLLLTSFLLLLTSFLLLLTSYFLVPSPSFAQGHYHVLSSASALQVFPDSIIDFGRVRVGAQRDSFFFLDNTSNSSFLTLQSLDYSTSLNGTEFEADSIESKGSSGQMSPETNLVDTVRFLPKHLGPDTGSIPIIWASGGTTYYTPTVYLIGTGVAPHVISSSYNFPDERVDSGSPRVTISIANDGSDTTAIDDVSVVNTAEILDSDFQVSLDSLPTSGKVSLPLRIGYEGGDSTLSFSVQFQPHSLGFKTLVVRIHTVDDSVLFDTITGKGVEPLVLLNTQTIDFGTITLQPYSSLPVLDTFFIVSNASGTYPALIDTLTHDTSGNFAVQLYRPTTSHDTLAVDSSVRGTVTFAFSEVGDFTDTVYIPNDTRYDLYRNADSNYRPMIVLKAKVRTGSIGLFAASLDTVTTCDTVRDTITIINPYPVELVFDSIALVSDTAGFSYGQNTFGHTIKIPPYPNGAYPFYFAYAFPADSLNGLQALKMLLFQSQLDSEQAVVDTITDSVIRQQQVIALAAQLPPAGSVGMSAADIAELRVPVTLHGLRSGVTELNSWTLSMKFSNDLFVPTAIDTTGSLAVAGDPSYTLKPYWDESTLTYTIVATGTSVSDPAKIANDLLLTILMQAYVTTDTVVTVTPTFTLVTRPCAYNLQASPFSIQYAEDCGDETIREVMEGETPSFILTGSWPNPATSSSGVSIGYYAAEPREVTATVFSAAGISLGQIVTAIGAGAGTFTLPEPLIPISGPAFVRVEAVSSDGSNSVIQTCKIAVMK
jgi:hypothetical protein